MQESLIQTLFHWQGLVGALIGAAGALAVAFVVSASIRWDEIRSAAGQLHYGGDSYTSMAAALQEGVVVEEDIRARSFRDALSIIRLRPTLPNEFDALAGRFIGVDPYLSLLLAGCEMTSGFIEREAPRLCELHDAALRGEDTGYSDREIIEMMENCVANITMLSHYFGLAMPRLKEWTEAKIPPLMRRQVHKRFKKKQDKVPKTEDVEIKIRRRISRGGGLTT